MSEHNDPPLDLRIERTFDAPVAVVWQLWTEPEHVAAWYGPEGATLPSVTMDVRVGGSRHVCMEVDTPNGPVQMWFAGEYQEVVRHRLLVYTESMSGPGGETSVAGPGEHAVTEVRVEFEDLGSRTRIVLIHAGIPGDSPGAAGWQMALDKLAHQLSRPDPR